jgi:phosphoglycolate phosphatase-like HAD superfamily hydrolase
MKNSINTILFDFDGVIVDTFGISYGTMKKVTPNPPDEDGYRSWFNGNIYDKDEAKLKGDKVEEDDPFFKIWTPLLFDLEPVEGIVEAIKELHKDYRMVVVSSTLGGPIKGYLDKHDLSRHFDKIYGSDVHRSKIVKMKMVFDEFGIGPDNCVFITDTLGDMREAAKMGIDSIGVTWGFQKLESLQAGNPIGIVSSPDDLVEILKNKN